MLVEQSLNLAQPEALPRGQREWCGKTMRLILWTLLAK
jgi:hypothetical protein